MNLGYKQKFPDGTLTYFREKLWLATPQMPNWIKRSSNGYVIPEELKPKFHSIRTDEKDRWHAGLDVHHLYNGRTPERENFLISTCVSVQKIMIIETPRIVTDEEGNDRSRGRMRTILVDGKIMKPLQMDTLAVNDGFNNLEHFFSWFPLNYVGKIIHFTPLRY